MAIEYANQPLDWDNEGIIPPQDLTEKGFQPGYKPPAEYFNAILYNIFATIKEIQGKTVELAITVDDGTNTNSDTVTAKVICVGNGEEHKGGLYIGDTPINYGEADDMLNNSIVMGTANNNAGQFSIVSGYNNSCATQCIVVGFSNKSNGIRSIVVGESNINDGSRSIVCGTLNKLKATNSFVTGLSNDVNGDSVVHGIICGGASNTVGEKDNASYSIIAGNKNNVNGGGSVVVGFTNAEKGAYNVVGGRFHVVNGVGNAVFGTKNINHVDGGLYTSDNVFMAGLGNKAIAEANSGADFSAVFGFGNIAKGTNFVCGIFSKTPNPTDDPYYTNPKRGDLFVIGNGTGTRDDNYNVTATTRSNAFRVACDGSVYGTKSYTASGADYAEMFEWTDGNPNNEDRRGLFVTLDGEKIRLANADDDYILGVVSAAPSVVADAQTDDWGKKWKTDVFGERLLDENGAWILNENFREEENESYVSRLDRKEWAAVGLVGKLIVVDDGTCEVNGYCIPANLGIATKSKSGYRVLSRVDENHIKVLIK